MGHGTYNQKVKGTVAFYEVLIPYYGTYNKKDKGTVTFIAIAVPHYTLMRYSRSIIVTSSGSKLLVHSTLKNRSEAKIPSFSMMKTPAEPSFYYLSIDHYSLAIALLIQQ